MAFSNTFTGTTGTDVGPAVGNREDLTDLLTILEPEETPLTSLAGKEKAKQPYHEFQVDDLAAPNADGVIEGSDVDAFADKFANRARLGNYCQIFRRPYKVSNVQEATDTAGNPAVNIAGAESKALRETKRDVEFAICSETDRQAGDAANPYLMRGIGHWITPAQPADVPAAYRTPSGSTVSDAENLNEAELQTVLASIFTQTGRAGKLTAVVGTTIKNLISNFTRVGGASSEHYNTPGSDKKITLSVQSFDSDYGVVNIILGNPACMNEVEQGIIGDMSLLKIAELIPMGSQRLENQGGGERGFVDCMLTCSPGNPLGWGYLYT